MTEIEEKLGERLALMTDEALLGMIENKSEDFTPEALAIINAEVAHRGSLEALRSKVEESRKQQTLPQVGSLVLLKRFYPVLVLISYGLFMYSIHASLWFYWLCLFALIASLFAVLFKPPFNPADEIRELNAAVEGDPGSPPAIVESGNNESAG